MITSNDRKNRVFAAGTLVIFNSRKHYVLAGPVADYHPEYYYWILPANGESPLSVSAREIYLPGE